MVFQVQLTNLKKLVMKKIGEAATTQNARLISAYSAIANRIEEDERTLAALEKRPLEYEEQLKRMDQASLESPQSELITPTDLEQVNGKQLARDARRRFVKSGPARGYRLEQLSRTTYKTDDGRRVACAFANENKPDRWWLGVEDAKHAVVVLQCRRRDGEILDFVIPSEVSVTFWSALSRNGGQVKFNVVREGESYYLLVPGSDRFSINRFRAFYGPLMSSKNLSHMPARSGVKDAEDI